MGKYQEWEIMNDHQYHTPPLIFDRHLNIYLLWAFFTTVLNASIAKQQQTISKFKIL